MTSSSFKLVQKVIETQIYIFVFGLLHWLWADFDDLVRRSHSTVCVHAVLYNEMELVLLLLEFADRFVCCQLMFFVACVCFAPLTAGSSATKLFYGMAKEQTVGQYSTANIVGNLGPWVAIVLLVELAFQHGLAALLSNPRGPPTAAEHVVDSLDRLYFATRVLLGAGALANGMLSVYCWFHRERNKQGTPVCWLDHFVITQAQYLRRRWYYGALLLLLAIVVLELSFDWSLWDHCQRIHRLATQEIDEYVSKEAGAHKMVADGHNNAETAVFLSDEQFTRLAAQLRENLKGEL